MTDGGRSVSATSSGPPESSGIALGNQFARLIAEWTIAIGTRRRKEVVWIKPELVAEVAFRAWTDDGKLRHASFKGLREEADADAIHELL
jgi:bifunctional non-homologous end joining protein LigD